MRQRNNMQVWTPAELAIHNAMQQVEKMDAHVLLTDAVVLLNQAKEKVADFIDATPEQNPTASNSVSAVDWEADFLKMWHESYNEILGQHEAGKVMLWIKNKFLGTKLNSPD
jgi:ABC-type taurine transport system ATPase subunit